MGRPQAAEVSRNESRKASSARREEKCALLPDERCSTRPLNRRRRCLSLVLRGTTNAPWAESIDVRRSPWLPASRASADAVLCAVIADSGRPGAHPTLGRTHG